MPFKLRPLSPTERKQHPNFHLRMPISSPLDHRLMDVGLLDNCVEMAGDYHRENGSPTSGMLDVNHMLSKDERHNEVQKTQNWDHECMQVSLISQEHQESAIVHPDALDEGLNYQFSEPSTKNFEEHFSEELLGLCHDGSEMAASEDDPKVVRSPLSHETFGYQEEGNGQCGSFKRHASPSQDQLFQNEIVIENSDPYQPRYPSEIYNRDDCDGLQNEYYNSHNRNSSVRDEIEKLHSDVNARKSLAKGAENSHEESNNVNMEHHIPRKDNCYYSEIEIADNTEKIAEDKDIHSSQRDQNVSASPKRQMPISPERSHKMQPSRQEASEMEAEGFHISPPQDHSPSHESPKMELKRSPSRGKISSSRHSTHSSQRDQKGSTSSKRQMPISSERSHRMQPSRQEASEMEAEGFHISPQQDHTPSSEIPKMELKRSPSRGKVSSSRHSTQQDSHKGVDSLQGNYHHNSTSPRIESHLKDDSSRRASHHKADSPPRVSRQRADSPPRETHGRAASPRKHLSSSPHRHDSPRRKDRPRSQSPVRREPSGHKRDHHDRSRSRSPNARDRHRRSPRRRHSPRHRSPLSGSHSHRRSPRTRRRPSLPLSNRNSVVGKPGRNLFVAGFSFATTERDLERKFSRFGHVRGVRIVRDKRSGDSRGFGFVSLEKDADADVAILALNQTEWNGRIVLVEKSKTSAR